MKYSIAYRHQAFASSTYLFPAEFGEDFEKIIFAQDVENLEAFKYGFLSVVDGNLPIGQIIWGAGCLIVEESVFREFLGSGLEEFLVSEVKVKPSEGALVKDREFRILIPRAKNNNILDLQKSDFEQLRFRKMVVKFVPRRDLNLFRDVYWCSDSGWVFSNDLISKLEGAGAEGLEF
jgi:hypothetical protein